MRLLVTGASGFVGSKVVSVALENGFEVVGQSRTETPLYAQGKPAYRHVKVDITKQSMWDESLNGIDCIVHCAARVHQMNVDRATEYGSFFEVNTLGTINLAKQACEAGVKRFIFLSSIKVNGESTLPNQKFTPSVSQAPEDAYGRSKYDAEMALKQLSLESEMEIVIVRPPLVYGPNVKANFLNMMRWIERGIPLPLGAVHNRRSMVFLDNLVDLLMTCCTHPKAKNEVFLVSDNSDISTSGMLREISSELDRPSRLIPLPSRALLMAATLLGKKDIAQRLCGNLQVDMSATTSKLDWSPKISTREGIAITVAAYQNKE